MILFVVSVYLLDYDSLQTNLIKSNKRDVKISNFFFNVDLPNRQNVEAQIYKNQYILMYIYIGIYIVVYIYRLCFIYIPSIFYIIYTNKDTPYLLTKEKNITENKGV